MTHAEKNAVMLEALEEAICEKGRTIKGLLDKVDDLAQELAVTQCQLEDARKRLKRYEGGGN